VEEFLGRGRGPLLNPSGNGILLTLGLSCALMFYPKLGRLGRISIVLSIPIFLAGIYCTLTRCVWLGGLGALLGILWLTMPKRFRLSFAIAILSGGIFVVAMKSESFVSFKRDKNVSVADMQQSALLRPILAVFAWQMFQDHPIVGVGTGQYLKNVKNYLGERKVDIPLEKAKSYVQHNIFLALLVENGLVGMLPFMALLGCCSWWAWRLWQATQLELEYRQTGLVFLGFMSGYITNGMFQDALIIPMVSAYLFFLAGCVCNLTQTHLLEAQKEGRFLRNANSNRFVPKLLRDPS
jgi:O-antigen ligase